MKFNIIDIITIIRMPKQRWQRQANYPHTHRPHHPYLSDMGDAQIVINAIAVECKFRTKSSFELHKRKKEEKEKYKFFASEIFIFPFLILSTAMCGSGWCRLVGCLLQIVDLFLGSQKCRRTHQFLARSYDDAETHKRRHWLRQKIETRNRILNLKNNIS